MTRIRAAFVVAFVLLLSACSSTADQSQEVEGREYWSTSARSDDAPHVLVEGTRVTMRFHDGRLQASGGCNSIGGSFDIQDGELRTTGLVITEMGCDAERHTQDQFLTELLASSPSIVISGDTLRLATSSASIDFIDAVIANPDLELDGTVWEIDGFLSGDTASSFSTEVRGTIRILDGVMELFDGCVTARLPVEIDAAEIRFEPIGMSAAEACDAPPGYRQSIFAALSRGALGYKIDGANLTLTTPDNVGFTLKAVE